MAIMLKWEQTPSIGHYRGKVYRASIPAGWLVAYHPMTDEGEGGGGITFVPDPKHQWI